MPNASRNFLFTLNNYTDEDLESIVAFAESDLCTYLCYGLEVAPTTGTPHVQGYFRARRTMRVTTISRNVPHVFAERSHFMIANGSKEANRAYCFKTRDSDPTPNDIVYEHDNTRQGRRTDLEDAVETMKDQGMRGLIDKHAGTFVKYHSGFRALQASIFSDRDPTNPPDVWWWYGPTGTGKTRQAFEFATRHGLSIWKSSKDLTWWQGYEQQQIALIDDFRKDFCKFHTLLTILDRYPHSVEVKGSSVPLNSPYIIVTSCYPPWQVYDTREDVGQLLRRIGQVVHFAGVGSEDGQGAERYIADVPIPFVPGAAIGYGPAGELQPQLDERRGGFAGVPAGKPQKGSNFAFGFTDPAGCGESVSADVSELSPLSLRRTQALGAPATLDISTDELYDMFMEN